MIQLHHTPAQRMTHVNVVLGRLGWIAFELIRGHPWRFGVMGWNPRGRRNFFWLPGWR